MKSVIGKHLLKKDMNDDNKRKMKKVNSSDPKYSTRDEYGWPNETRVTRIVKGGGGSKEDIDYITEIYYELVFNYILKRPEISGIFRRDSYSTREEAARDLTHEFLEKKLMTPVFLQKAGIARSEGVKFRAFLRKRIEWFLKDQFRGPRLEKELVGISPELEGANEGLDSGASEADFDSQWFQMLIGEAIERSKRELLERRFAYFFELVLSPSLEHREPPKSKEAAREIVKDKIGEDVHNGKRDYEIAEAVFFKSLKDATKEAWPGQISDEDLAAEKREAVEFLVGGFSKEWKRRPENSWVTMV